MVCTYMACCWCTADNVSVSFSGARQYDMGLAEAHLQIRERIAEGGCPAESNGNAVWARADKDLGIQAMFPDELMLLEPEQLIAPAHLCVHAF